MDAATRMALNYATRIADMAAGYRDALLETGRDDSCEAMLAEIRLLDAIDLLWSDCVTDIRDTRADELAIEYGLEPDGSEVEHEGWHFDQTRVHPDDPCQSKGRVWA
jgi:hypothetical protein